MAHRASCRPKHGPMARSDIWASPGSLLPRYSTRRGDRLHLPRASNAREYGRHPAIRQSAPLPAPMSLTIVALAAVAPPPPQAWLLLPEPAGCRSPRRNASAVEASIRLTLQPSARTPLIPSRHQPGHWLIYFQAHAREQISSSPEIDLGRN
ncbi:hypothetical protein DAI22_12g170050 [Oryza sativa Japonica Group]|nr:hypothetical protein DAI22_12g170050 [Oryza sativa Japonica Group]